MSDIDSQVGGFFKITSLGSLVKTGVDTIILIGALAALFFMLMGGFNYITSGGDKTKTEAAQKQITNSIVGLVIAASAFAIFRFVVVMLGLDEAITINS